MKRLNVAVTILLCLFILQSVIAKETGGGVIVGNGAGVVEANFQHAYQVLDQLIPAYNENSEVNSESEKILLQKIHRIIQDNLHNRDRFRFLSESMHPGFFDTGLSELSRIAKTGDRPGDVIYINSDLLYKDKKPALTFKQIVSLVFHEVGHQTGELNHQLLDSIGADIASYLDVQTHHYQYKEKENHAIFSITNFSTQQNKMPILFLNWKNEKVHNLSSAVWAGFDCPPKQTVSAELSNGHFQFTAEHRLVFRAWLQVQCVNEAFVSKRELTVQLNPDLSFLGLIISAM